MQGWPGHRMLIYKTGSLGVVQAFATIIDFRVLPLNSNRFNVLEWIPMARIDLDGLCRKKTKFQQPWTLGGAWMCGARPGLLSRRRNEALLILLKCKVLVRFPLPLLNLIYDYAEITQCDPCTLAYLKASRELPNFFFAIYHRRAGQVRPVS